MDTLNEVQQHIYENLKKEGFKPVNRDSYNIFKKFEGDNLLEERTATIITAWSPENHGLYKVIDGYLCALFFLKTKPEYFIVYRTPGTNENLQMIIDKLYCIAKNVGLPDLRIEAIENRFLKAYTTDITGYNIETFFNKNDSEYAYKIEDLTNLDGSINYYKRKRVNLYCDREDVRLEPMTKQNVELVKEIEKKWCEASSDCDECRSYYGCEKHAIDEMVLFFDENIHTGLIGYEGDLPVAYIICERVNKNVSYTYFGKGIDDNFFVYIIYMLFKTYINDTDYMNIGEDLGEFGLRFFKRKLSLNELWERHCCIYKKIQGKHGR
ncbi:hypothetical protein FACS1894102_3530 [Spirochaetia bacterium]|nr:hypothetical protein FACS1894102_3530 [Spirochaetia bacterium]